MELTSAAAVLVAGIGAGAINTLVGSGTLLTFPTLLAIGLPPVSANVSNNLGLVAGGLSGTWSYRMRLAALRPTLRRWIPVTVLGAIAGSLALLWAPSQVFERIVPLLIALATLLVLIRPMLERWLPDTRQGGALGTVGSLLAAIYGGYFGAAQGVVQIGLLSATTDLQPQDRNAIKNALVTLVNLVAAVLFLGFAWNSIVWPAVGLIAVGSLLGGLLGGAVGQRLPNGVMRGVVVIVGIGATGVAMWGLRN